MIRGFKYEVGEKMRFEKSYSKDVECSLCGHIETEYRTRKKTATIKDRSYMIFYHVTDFITTSTTEIIDGKIVHTPHMNPITTTQDEPAYLIDGDWKPETSLTPPQE